MNTDKKLLPIVAGVIALLVVGVGLLFLFRGNESPDAVPITSQKVNITVPDGIVANLYVSDDGHGNQSDDIKPIQTLSSSKTITLETGSYQLLSDATATYAEGDILFTVNNKTIDVRLTPDYSQEKLASLLSTEAPAIRAAIARDAPAALKYYRQEPGWLYKQGDWYGTKLTYIGPETYDTDTLLLVAQKKNGRWELVTKPPAITVSLPLYPQIPSDIASDMNNFR